MEISKKYMTVILFVVCLAIGIMMVRQFDVFYPGIIPFDFGNVAEKVHFSEETRATFGKMAFSVAVGSFLIAAIVFKKYLRGRKKGDF